MTLWKERKMGALWLSLLAENSLYQSLSLVFKFFSGVKGLLKQKLDAPREHTPKENGCGSKVFFPLNILLHDTSSLNPDLFITVSFWKPFNNSQSPRHNKIQLTWHTIWSSLRTHTKPTSWPYCTLCLTVAVSKLR